MLTVEATDFQKLYSNPDYPPIILMDYKVICWKIINALNNLVSIIGDPEHPDVETWIRATWATLINRGIDSLPWSQATLVIVDDSKPYWRSEYLENLGFPKYKGSRSEKPAAFFSVVNYGYSYIQNPGSPWFYFSAQGYEADDWAGLAARIKQSSYEVTQEHLEYGLHNHYSESALDNYATLSNRPLFLYTVDNDWLQLVSNDYGIYWANTGPWVPRLRDESGAAVWAKKQLKADISSPRDIATIKAAEGDKGDDLIPGSPIEVIDLWQPPEAYRMAEYSDSLLAAMLSKPNLISGHLKNAKKWIISRGYPYVAGLYKLAK